MDATATPLPAAHRKSLGAFYTPAPMAKKMIDWAIRAPSDRALDPSFGGLVFLAEAHTRLVSLGLSAEAASARLYGVDLDEGAHAAARMSPTVGLGEQTLLHRDFFTTKPGEDLPLVEAVVGNPPYVRYQGWNDASTVAHELAAAAGVPLTRLSSSWAPFVLHSTAFVADGGRLALVLPAEILHAQYARGVLRFVERRFARTTLVLFEKRVFPGALEEVVLLFAAGRGQGVSSVEVVECETLADLDVEAIRTRTGGDHAERQAGESTARKGKLLAQLLPDATSTLYERLAAGSDSGTQTLGELASVDIGAVTGANKYFLLAPDEEPGLAEELLRPAISKAIHARGARFTQCDFDNLVRAGTRCRMFVADELTPERSLATAAPYLRRGRELRLHERYKCRVRDPWWAVPLPLHGVPDLFLTYCASEHPRLVVNEAGALHTNTIHGVTVAGDLSAPALAAAFYNSLTLLSAELVGRSYGGGVLKLEPTEAEALLIPPVTEAGQAEVEAVDSLLRAGDLAAVLDRMDRLLLIDGLGLSETEVGLLRAGAERLRTRRRSRGRAPA